MAELSATSGKTGANRVKRMPVRVDLTAMVDLAFLLITFFMLTTSLAKPRVMPLIMPTDGPAGPVSDKRTMTICLGSHNKIMWYMGLPDKPSSATQVTGYGKDIRTAIVETGKQVKASTGHGLIVIIKPDANSVYANLVDALDEMNITQVPTYAIAKLLPQDINLLKQQGIY
jgi:biopolymer transport protein ExbD